MKKWMNTGIFMPLLVVFAGACPMLFCMPASAQSSPSQPIGNNTYLLPPGNVQPAPPLPPSSDVGEYAEQRLQQAQQQAEQQALLRAQEEANAALGTPPNVGGVLPSLTGSTTAQPPAPPKRPPSLDEARKEQMERWNSDPSQALRQSGGKLELPLHHGFFFSTHPQDQDLLHNWVHALKNEGIAEEKIIFEAQRLSKEEFVRWASRFVWLEQQLHPNIIDVYP